MMIDKTLNRMIKQGIKKVLILSEQEEAFEGISTEVSRGPRDSPPPPQGAPSLIMSKALAPKCYATA